jgi:hypothetical protein
MRKFAHNERIRCLTERVRADYENELGPVSLKQRILGTISVAYALREKMRVANGTNVYQATAAKTGYRMSSKDLWARRLEGKSLGNLLHLDIRWSDPPLLVKLRGILDSVNARTLFRMIRTYLKNQGGELTVDLDRLVAVEERALRRLLNKLKKYNGRARVVYTGKANAVREAIARLPENLLWLFVGSSLLPAYREVRSDYELPARDE